MSNIREYQQENPESQTIIVTGASAGLGYAIAKFLISQHQPTFHVVVVSGRNAKPLLELKALETDNNGPRDRVKVFVGDLGETDMTKKLIQASQQVSDKLDGLLLNHGILGTNRRVVNTSSEDWVRTYQINVVSYVAIIKEAIPLLRRTRGRIIMTSSGNATSNPTSMGSYGATKAAINHLAATLKNEEPDITTLCIRPGKVDTAMQTELRENLIDDMDEKDAVGFRNAKRDGQLFKPEQPGNVMARLVLKAPKELSGRFFTWNDKEFAAFQD